MTVLVVDDDASVRGHLASLIDHFGHRVVEACGADWALTLFERHRPDLVLSDIDMPGRDGLWLVRQIREREAGHWTPVVFLSSLSRADQLAEGIDAGADDYLVKPVHPRVLEAKLRALRRQRATQQQLIRLSEALQQANAQLQHEAQSDGLTGLLNRRGFDRALAEALADGRRRRSPLTLMVCDVDHFKAYNDQLGHAAGDDCLRQVAGLLRDIARRPSDLAARQGGEEFALILPDTPRSGALTLARAIGRMFAVRALPHPASPIAAHLTLSGGITSCVPDEHTTAEALMLRADEALYVAKRQGRNRFFSFEMVVGEADAAKPLADGLRPDTPRAAAA
ncbi:diguanylate cyclase domain-containing protein [Aquabacterium sp. OR-4]|uniref:diguanylate cyclase domain-containing protein n=1 Tax=Aquabacterium sp. OR-4 TaxID=2978127 RepID=UPI0028C73F20|nr:diguanylate cyclase [Aquabacterium sp. OR-4]MDT7837891.1 diguanylate cyclase [Aquabacterium sp. OR-4]